MKPLAAIFMALLITACTPEFPKPTPMVRAIQKIAVPGFVCLSETDVLDIAVADSESQSARDAAAIRLWTAGKCGTVPPRHVPLTELIHEYDDFTGTPCEVWRIGDNDLFTIIYANKQSERGA